MIDIGELIKTGWDAEAVWEFISHSMDKMTIEVGLPIEYTIWLVLIMLLILHCIIHAKVLVRVSYFNIILIILIIYY